MKCDFLIIGQGIAGSTLALELIRRGKRVLVVDRQDEGSSSRVAAGLVTPLTGKGMNPAWRQEVYLPIAEEFYRLLEQETQEEIYHHTDVVRLFESAAEREKWRKKTLTHGQWGREVAIDETSLQGEYGGIHMSGGAWLDTRKFLEVVKRELLQKDSFLEEEFRQEGVVFHSEGVFWNDVEAEKIILCQGAYGLGHGGWFGNIDHRCAKGEILTLKVKNLNSDTRYHAKGWLAPRGDGSWRAGATYDWINLDSEPTDEGDQEVLDKLTSWCDDPLEVVGSEAGVRPIIRNSRPVIGLHSEHTQLGFFNGLGSKGALMAPAVARHFADFLCGHGDLDTELNMAFLEDAMKPVATKNLIQTAHLLISEVVRSGDVAVDATVGNGHDTLFLTSLVGVAGEVIGFDVQEQAIQSTEARLKEAGIPMGNVTLHHCSHGRMGKLVGEELAAVVFNLGYLPGADKSLITQVDSTLDALKQAIVLLKPGGLLTVMCYPGHIGGDAESAAVMTWMKGLPVDQYGVTHYRREQHREGMPFLLAAHKK